MEAGVPCVEVERNGELRVHTPKLPGSNHFDSLDAQRLLNDGRRRCEGAGSWSGRHAGGATGLNAGTAGHADATTGKPGSQSAVDECDDGGSKFVHLLQRDDGAHVFREAGNIFADAPSEDPGQDTRGDDLLHDRRMDTDDGVREIYRAD